MKNSLLLFTKTLALLITLFLSLCLPTVYAKESVDKPEQAVSTDAKPNTKIDSANFFDDNLDNDLSEEMQLAKDDGKKGILIMFEMDECPFCARMKRTVLNQSVIQDYYRKHFRILSVDTEGDLELTDFKGSTTTQKDFALKQNRVRATPVFQFFDLEGKPLKNGRLTGVTKDADEFLLLGKYIVDAHHKTQSFFRFKRDQKQTKQ